MPVPTPRKVRQCVECKEIFATPDSLRLHKRAWGDCRTPEALEAVGFVKTPKGWLNKLKPHNSNR